MKWVCVGVCLLGLVSSTMYSLAPDWTVGYQHRPDEMATAIYDVKMKEDGWNYLSLFANPNLSLIQQHRAVGFLQGFVSYLDIHAAFDNLERGWLGVGHGANLHNFLDTQWNYITKQAKIWPKDIFWNQAEAYMQELRWMHHGYLSRLQLQGRLDLYIGFSQFTYLTLVGDLQDLLPALRSTVSLFDRNENDSSHQQEDSLHKQKKQRIRYLSEEQVKPKACNAFIKPMQGDVLVAHCTHNIYPFMLRIFKTKHFPSRDVRVGCQSYTFSSRPGDLTSKDDFYVLDNGMRVVETSLNNYKGSNYQSLTPESVPIWLRQNIAMNLARNPQEWIKYFLRETSGTHNNQWMVIDIRQPLQPTVILIEQAFDEHSVVNMTQRLKQQGYVASYNMPLTDKVFTKLGYNPDSYHYDTDPRAIILKKYNSSIIDVESAKYWLLNNEEEDPRVGLAPRYDLYTPHPQSFGLTDCKITTLSTDRNGFLWAISGPSQSNGRFPPFDPTTWPNMAQENYPKLFNFTWQQVYIPDSS